MDEFEFLGPYRIGKTLGRGGMGNVYHGEHVKSGDLVAVKVIASSIADEPRFRRRFDKEIKTLKMLRHPGIVRLVGFGEQDGQLFYSMELVEGETLQQVIRRDKKLAWQSVIEYAIQICGALKHAHDIGVTHRDIKPANLIITSDNQVKLVDFGIPKVFGDMSEQTAAGSVLGTPDYMAPEQANGDPITARTDLYALGSVMYAMLTGRAPFRGRNATEVIKSLTRDDPIPLDMLDVEMPPELGELVHQLLQKKEADRPRTALMVSNRLKAMQAVLTRDQTIASESLQTSADPSKQQTPIPSSASQKKTVVTHQDGDLDGDQGDADVETDRTKAKGTVADSPVLPTQADSEQFPSPSSPSPSTSPSGKTVAQAGTVATGVDEEAVSKSDANQTGADQDPPASHQQPFGHSNIDAKTLVSDGGATALEDGREGQLGSPDKSVVRRGTGNSVPGAATNVNDADADGGEADDADGSATQSRPVDTHFSTVDDSEVGTGIFQTDDENSTSKSQRIAAIATMLGMFAILGLGAFMLYRAMQPPTSDDLYQQAISGDFAAAATFLRRFPADDRFNEVEKRHMNRRLDATLNRLTAKSKVGLSDLEPSEETFLKIFEQRETQPAATAEKLVKWLAVYEDEVSEDKSGDAATRQLEMIELAKFMTGELASTLPKQKIDKRASDLMARIDKASKIEDPSAAKTKLEAIISTFQEQPWAEPAVAEAKQRLADLPSQ